MGSLLFYADLMMAFRCCWVVVGVYCIGEKKGLFYRGYWVPGSTAEEVVLVVRKRGIGFMAEHFSIEQG